MRLLEIELTNWKCHRNLSVDLSGGLEISGRNGTGKSSILEAVRYCFSSHERGIKQKITNGERSLKVRLTFTLDKKQYIIEKTVHQDKPSEASLTVNGAQIADNPSTVASEIGKIMDESVWDRLLYVPQGGLTNFVEELGGREGRKKFDALFGLDALEEVWTATGERIRDEEARFRAVGEEIAKYPKNAGEEYDRERTRLSGEAERMISEIKNFDENRAAIVERIRGLELRIEHLAKAKNRRKELSEKLRETDVLIARKQKDLETAEKGILELESMRKEVDRLSQKRRELERYPKIQEKLRLIESFSERIESFKNLDEVERNVSKKKEALTREGDIRLKHRAESMELAKFDDTAAKVRHDIELKREHIESLQSLTGEGKCPRCGQVLYAGRIAIEIDNTIRDINRLIDWQESNIGNLEQKRVLVESLENELARIGELRAQLEIEERALHERKREWERALTEINSQESALKMLGYKREGMEVVGEMVDEFSRINAGMEILSKEIAEAEKSKTNSDAMKRELERLTWEREATSAELERTTFSEGEHEQLLKEKNAQNESRYIAESEMKERNFRLKETERRIGENEEKRLEYREVRRRLDESERKVKLLKRAREVFHTDKGLPKYLRDKYVGQLGTLLSRYFNQFNQNPAYKGVDFNRDYSIQVKSMGGTLSLDQLSGGERVQLAVALRIALIEILSPTRTLILDEPFGSLDVEHRELLGETLNKMAASWQLIVVTHVEVESLTLPKLELGGY